MNKSEFLGALRKGLHGLPQDDIEERLAFYGEMIDDRTEEGLSEEEAVSAVGAGRPRSSCRRRTLSSSLLRMTLLSP